MKSKYFQEATRTNDLIEQLSASIKNATYKVRMGMWPGILPALIQGIIKNTKVLEKSFAGLFKCSTEEAYKDTLEKLLITMKDPEHDPHIMAQVRENVAG